MNRATMNVSLAGVLLFLLWTFCIIAVASERRSKESSPSVSQPEFEKLAVTTLERSSMRAPEGTKRPSQITSIQDPKPVLQKRKAIRPKTSERRSYLNQFNFKDAETQALDEYDVREYARNKRFYPIEPGCIKGYVCCQNPYCRQFCSLCRGQSTNQYQSAQPGIYECEDLNNNTICDYEEEDVEDEAEKMLAEELERKKKEEEEKEKMLAEELERMKKEEEEKEKMLAEELERMKKEEEEKEKAEMEAQEQERKKMEAEEQDRKNKKNETKLSRGQLEFTHHIYEEYQPQFQAETKAPIILQTIPQYSISNYYSLSRHQHPTSLALTPFSNHAHSSSSSIPSPPHSPTPISPHSHHHRHFSHSQHSFDSFNPHTIQNHVAGHHSSLGLEGQRHSNPTLFYEDIHPTSGLGSGSGTGPSAPPPMTHIANGRHHYKQHRYPKHLFDNPDEAPPLYVSSSAGSKPLADPYNFNPNHHHSLPQAQTVIYQDPPRHNTPAPAPPQPLLKYHLIRQSYPASGENKDYFAEIPAFLPGPPYLPQALPSRKTPVIQRPHRKRNRQGKLVALKSKKKKQTKSKQPKRKPSRIGALVRNLLG